MGKVTNYYTFANEIRLHLLSLITRLRRRQRQRLLALKRWLLSQRPGRKPQHRSLSESNYIRLAYFWSIQPPPPPLDPIIPADYEADDSFDPFDEEEVAFKARKSAPAPKLTAKVWYFQTYIDKFSLYLLHWLLLLIPMLGLALKTKKRWPSSQSLERVLLHQYWLQR